MRCLILGGIGFIGSHLVDALHAQGHFVRVFDRAKISDIYFQEKEQLEYFEGDFLNEVDLSNAVKGIDVCFHLVSTTLPKSSNDNPVFDVETNLLGTVELLQCAVDNGVKRVIFVSSGGTVYGVPKYIPIDERHPTDPICSYGIVKLAVEKYLHLYRKLHGLDYAVLRLSNPYGGRQRSYAVQGAVAVFLGKVLKDHPVEIWGDGSVVRDYLHISDVVRALLLSMEYEGRENVINIGSGQGVSINELVDTIENVTGKEVKRVYTEGRKFDVPCNVLAIDRAKRELGWEPQVPLDTGVQQFAQSMGSEVESLNY